ncbi:hypothetical protein BDV23DRAFT_189553 [Aspergillus alliaceus]|uniref:FAD-binding domain-containing protein n=1 Tax=Petromyces alliaceus TaxID=209559 RepID=A0A5N7BQN1_PETAA|nr:hypothetical protein BDV23DRAFT_189553 [Aspergillus alliaceus]
MSKFESFPRPTRTYHSQIYDRISNHHGFNGAGKTILVTGDSSGVGHSICKAFAQAVARIAIISRSRGPQAQAKAELEAAYPSTQILTYQASIIDSTRMTDILQELAMIDVLVLCAAVVHRAGESDRGKRGGNAGGIRRERHRGIQSHQRIPGDPVTSGGDEDDHQCFVRGGADEESVSGWVWAEKGGCHAGDAAFCLGGLAVLHRVSDWDPAIEGLIRNTPKRATVHWPLLWRNLRQGWTSKGGRVVQVGDAAHTTVPASISGGTLAIEDAVTLAACLQLACSGGAPGGAPLGARIYNLLRYQRVSCVQKMSFVNSENLGAVDMDEVLKKDPEKVKVRFPKWLFQHDPEAYVYEKYGQAFSHLVLGTDFDNTNFPPGHKFKMWTIEEIHADILAGKKVADLLDGDWD